MFEDANSCCKSTYQITGWVSKVAITSRDLMDIEFHIRH